MKFFYLILLNIKIISLVPSATEILYKLGAEENLVGISSFCPKPSHKKIEIVGSFINADIEKIKKLNPDIVILTLPTQKNIAEQLKKLNIKTEIIIIKNVKDILNSIIKLGKLSGKEKRAKFIYDSLKQELKKIAKKYENKKNRPKVFVELSPKPLYTCGKFSFLNDYIKLAGGKNIFEDVQKGYFTINPEEVIKRNPDIILLIYPLANPERVKKRIGWDKINAVKNGKIYKLDPDLFLRPSVKFLKAIETLGKIINFER